MKFIRFLLTALATVVVLAILLVAAAFAPPLQTWFARMELLDQPGIQGSLGSLSARLGGVEIEDLKIQSDGIVLTLPSLQASLPVIDAAWHRRVHVKGVVAKGWTLDLTRLRDRELEVSSPVDGGTADAAAPMPVSPEKRAAFAFSGILSGWRLPFDVSLDGVDLEGVVLVPVLAGKPPVQVHLTVTGGAMAAGREGTFVIDADRVPDDPGSPANYPTAHCRLVISMDSPRSIDRVETKTDLSSASGSPRLDITLSAGAARIRGSDAETYTADLSRGERHLATVLAAFAASSRRFSGTWKTDLRDTDLALLFADRPLPELAASGSGQFDADAAFDKVHAFGRLNGNADRLGVVAPALDRLGKVTVGAQFDLTCADRSLHVDSLAASISGVSPVAEVRALQPFDCDEGAGGLTVSDPSRDWLDVTIRDFPLGRLPPLPGGITFSGGDAAGEFTVRLAGGVFALRGKSPLTATGVSVDRAGATFGRNFDLSVPILADLGAQQWQFQWSPLGIDGDGRHLATIDAKGSWPTGAKQPLAVSGAWKADLDALSSLPSSPAFNWINGKSASGEFTANFGSSSEIECKLTVVGHDTAHVVSTTINADEDAGGAGELLAPVKIALGTGESEVSVDASWAGPKSEPRTEIKLSSENVALEDLRILAVPLAAAGGVLLPVHASQDGARWAKEGVRDQTPFWGDWIGRLTVMFDKLRTGDQDFTDVGGSFEVDHASIQLEGGHGELPSKSMANLEGSITFDASGAPPYILKGSASGLSNVDSALLLPPKPGEDPVIEGHFSVAGSLSGSGINLDNLISGTQEEFQLSSTSGIIRLLRTDIADAIPEAKEPVSDSLGDVGNFMGSVLGIKGHSIDPAKNKVGKVPEAVINFTNQVAEIGYDKISVDAIRGSDRTIRLAHLEMTAADEHLTGTGQISYVRGLPISEEPLSVDLQLGVHDVLIKLLSTAGLLSSSKDSLGYSLLGQPVLFGGTLAHIDDRQWHDLLARAAVAKPPLDKANAAKATR